MAKSNSTFLFNLIAPAYGLFYNIQKKRYSEVLKGVEKDLDIASFRTIIDIGCGTGALCSVLYEMGLTVTGIDPAKKMLDIAMAKPENININFIQADVLETLPVEDKSFDIAVASYVAHGLKSEERRKMYAEMSRVAEHWVVIYDYNDKRSLPVTVIEWLEGGDYFHFIKHAEPEMRDCVTEMKNCFSEVKVIHVDKRASWYICKPLS
ncbi:MAG: class I SAM-dependent methyltransferase [Bacillota bacterium]|nr:class I SAM-dependent methyltransferase [Bacillota bacterium]